MGSSRIKGLDGIRALCALFILLGHIPQRDFCQWDIVSLPLPECCAYVFFLISGFLAGYRIDHTGDILSYYRKKARRILPLYYSYVIISVLLLVGLGRSDEVLNSSLWYYLFLTPQIPFCSQTGIMPLAHLWFIGTIVLFYALFPFFTTLKEDKRIVGAAVIAVAWLLIKLSLRVCAGTESVLYHFVTITSLDVLFAGVFAGLLMRKENPVLVRMKEMTWLGLAAWLLFLGSGLYGWLVPAPVRVEFIALLAVVIIITQQASSPAPDLEINFLDWLGNISYEIYVVQIIVIILLSMAYSKVGIEIPDAIIYLVCTVLVIGVAWCFHKILGELIKVKHK